MANWGQVLRRERAARSILRTSLALEEGEAESLAERMLARFVRMGGLELDLPEREPVREPR